MRYRRVRIRTLMLAVVIVALPLAVSAHVDGLIRKHGGLAGLILILEGFAFAVVFVGAFVLGFFVLLVRKEYAYVTKLRRDRVPARCPWPPIPADPLEPE
jgi:hypothetical protein